MLRATREALTTYATGVGLPVADVIREFKALPEAQKFDVLARIKELEQKHQQYLARVAGEVAATGDNVPGNEPRQSNESAPLSEGEQAAA